MKRLLLGIILYVFSFNIALAQTPQELYDQGQRYLYGSSYEYDPAKGIASLEAAAEQGHVEAMFFLGHIYRAGRGVSEDHPKAVYWFEKAANEGHEDALRTIQEYYIWGIEKEDVPINPAKAIDILKRVAARDSIPAINMLARLYDDGRDAQQDSPKARQLYEKAATLGDAEAPLQLGYIYENADNVTQDYTKARQWYETAVKNGSKDAYARLALLHAKGLGVPVSNAKATALFEKYIAAFEPAESANHAYEIGTSYERGYSQWTRDFPQDDAKALYWYTKAAEQGNADAQYTLGQRYLSGKGVPQDAAQAFQWFEKAAKSSLEAHSQLAVMHYEGLGTPQNYFKAREIWEERRVCEYLLESSSKQEDIDAVYHLGYLYANGLGARQDFAKAKKCYRNACESAKYKLACDALDALNQAGR